MDEQSYLCDNTNTSRKLHYTYITMEIEIRIGSSELSACRGRALLLRHV